MQHPEPDRTDAVRGSIVSRVQQAINFASPDAEDSTGLADSHGHSAVRT